MLAKEEAHARVHVNVVARQKIAAERPTIRWRMVAAMSGPSFVDACVAIEDVLPRLTAMLRGIGTGTAPATGSWTVADVACHVSHVIGKDADALAGRPLPDIELVPAQVAVMTESMLDEDPERDVVVLADRIDAMGRAFLQLRDDPPTGAVTWIGGAQLPPSAVACHLLEELVVHGDDIATAAGVPWRIAPEHAALAITGGAVPIIAASPSSWVKHGGDRRRRARVEVRLRGHNRFVLALDRELHVELPPSGARVDAHLSADPAALLLVMLGRRSQWSAFVRGKVVAWGRRPQALLTLLANTSPP